MALLLLGLLVALCVASSGCYPTLRFEVQGPMMSGVTTVQAACPTPTPGLGFGGIGPSGAVVPAR